MKNNYLFEFKRKYNKIFTSFTSNKNSFELLIVNLNNSCFFEYFN